MKEHLLTGLSAEEQQFLVERGLGAKFSDVNGLNGIIVKENVINLAIELLGVTIEREDLTPYRDLFKTVLRRAVDGEELLEEGGEDDSYFFRRLNSKQIGQLRQAGIAFDKFSLGKRKGSAKGIIISREAIINVLSVLGLSIKKTKDTSYDGIRELICSRGKTREAVLRSTPPLPPPTFSVTVSDEWHGAEQENFRAIARDLLLPVMKMNILLSVPHGNKTSPLNDGAFHVFIWASPEGQKGHSTPAAMWGIPVDCRDSSFAFSGMGLPIVDPAHSNVAELVDNNLYIHHDLCHNGTSRELEIFKRICEATVALWQIKQSPKKFSAFLAEKTKEYFVTCCLESMGGDIKTLKKSIEERSIGVKRLQQEIVSECRKKETEEKSLQGLLASQDNQIGRIEKEFGRLIATPKVEKIEVLEQKISAYTKMLYCVDPRTEISHEIGKFRIEININANRNNSDLVRWFNLTRQTNITSASDPCIMQAPHVQKDGHACLGTAAEIFPELIGKYEFAAAIAIAIQFVESVNTDDSWGANISRWPIAKAKEVA